MNFRRATLVGYRVLVKYTTRKPVSNSAIVCKSRVVARTKEVADHGEVVGTATPTGCK
jgi:hypothetical protein